MSEFYASEEECDEENRTSVEFTPLCQPVDENDAAHTESLLDQRLQRQSMLDLNRQWIWGQQALQRMAARQSQRMRDAYH